MAGVYSFSPVSPHARIMEGKGLFSPNCSVSLYTTLVVGKKNTKYYKPPYVSNDPLTGNSIYEKLSYRSLN